MSMTPYDVIIPYHEKDSDILPYCIDGLRKHITGFRNIYIISKECPDIDDDIIWIAESAFPFTVEDVGIHIKSTNAREGWYYQQLLKLYAHRVIPGLLPHHMILDSDNVFIRSVEFFKGDTILLDYGGLYVPEYFEHMKKLLPKDFETTSKESGVTDCIIFMTSILDDLFKRIEIHHGCPVWEAFLKCVEPETYNKSGMSEYEIYFQFVLAQYPGAYELRQIKRSWGVNLNELKRTDVDVIAFHDWFRDWQTGKIKDDLNATRSAE